MKILLINKYYAPDVGGVETAVKDYATNYFKEGHSVTVLCIHKNFSPCTKRSDMDGIKVLRCASLGTFMSMPVSLIFPIYLLFGCFTNNRIIFHLPFPLVDVCSWFLWPFKRRVMVVWHSDIVRQKLFRFFIRPFTHLLLNVAGTIVVTSPRLVESSNTLRRYKKKCCIVPLSVDNKASYGILQRGRLDEHDSLGHLQKGVDFIFLGRLCYYKGVDVLCSAIRELSKKGANPMVFIAGEGEDSYKFKKLAGELSNVVFYNKFLSENDKILLLSKARCMLFPSVASSEAFGITQLEALSTGTPVINTYLPTGVPWVSLDGKTGLTVEPGRSNELAKAMMNMMALDVSAYNAMAHASKRRAVEVFDVSIVRALQLELLSR